MAKLIPETDRLAIAMRGVAVASLRQPAVVVAEEVNWDVQPGEFWVVAGPQRSGKTDLLMVTAGLTSPAGGTYRCFGEPMPIFDEERLKLRLRLSYVFDGGQLFSRMTIAENVALPLRYHEDISRTEAEPFVQSIMEALELVPFAHCLPGSVARNWQKRAGLARALVLKPSVLLVDNPLGGLDARHAAWWLNFLEQLTDGQALAGGQPMTVVVTTDDLPRLAVGLRKPCRFAVLREGKFQTVGDRDALYGCREPWVKELLVGEETNRAD